MEIESFNVWIIYRIKTLEHSVSIFHPIESSNEIDIERRKCHVLISIVQALYISTTVLHKNSHITLGLPVISGEVKLVDSRRRSQDTIQGENKRA